MNYFPQDYRLPIIAHLLQRKEVILVVTDIFSKWVEAFALHSVDTEALATVLFNEIICWFEVSLPLHSDEGANLTSQSLCKMPRN